MKTPSGRPSVGASRLGYRYQDLVAWQQALHAAHPSSTATDYHVESPDGATYDDVVTIDPRGSRYIQAKHVVNAPGGFSLDWLLEPQGKKRESMAQKALRTYRALREQGPVQLLLLTNRELEASDPLGDLRDPTSFTLHHVAQRVLDGQYEDAALRAALTTLEGHLACSCAEMLELLDVWKLQWAYGLPHVTELVKLQMQVYGLRQDEDALLAGTAFIERLQTLGMRRLMVAELRSKIEDLDLRSDRYVRTLSVAAVDVEHNAATAQVALDLRSAFDGRVREQARGLDGWETVDSQLQQAVADLGSPADAPVLVHASVRLPFWFRLGTLMRATAGWTVGCQLGPDLYFSDDAPQDEGVLQSSSASGSGEHLVVSVNVTRDICQVVTTRVADLGFPSSRRLDLRHPSPGQTALSGPQAARRVAEEIKDALNQALEQNPTSHVHLFMSCPKPIALLLGSHWHRLAPVTVYEDLGVGKGYQAAFTITE